MPDPKPPQTDHDVLVELHQLLAQGDLQGALRVIEDRLAWKREVNATHAAMTGRRRAL